MSAFLVERDPEAHKKLAQVLARYPDISIKTYSADFLTVLSTILNDIPADAFAFFLIDPKGWRIPLNAFAPMLARPNSEVIFNFMFDFINRAASIKEPTVVSGWTNSYRMGIGEQNSIRRSVLQAVSLLTNAKRSWWTLLRKVLPNWVTISMWQRRPSSPSERPTSLLLILCDASSHWHKGVPRLPNQGLGTIKDSRCNKVKHAETSTGQGEIFQSLHDMGPDELTAFLQSQRAEAEKTFLELAPEMPCSILYELLWPQVLTRHVVRLTDVNQIGARLRTRSFREG
jgi:hypothetical protein